MKWIALGLALLCLAASILMQHEVTALRDMLTMQTCSQKYSL